LENTEPKKSRRIIKGKFRWIVIGLIVGTVLALGAIGPVVMPHIQVPAEPVFGPMSLPVLGDFYFTNTILATLVTDVILILSALVIRRATRGDTLYLEGVSGIFEMIIEGVHNLVESTTVRWAKTIFPWVATIIIFVLFANLSGLIPGYESIGITHEPHVGGVIYDTEVFFSIGNFELRTITEEVHLTLEEQEALHHDTQDASSHDVAESPYRGFVPFLRHATSDLNLTLALALISVVVTQIIGVRALGPGYFKKFFDFKEFFKMWTWDKWGPFDIIMPFVNIFVRLLELIAELAKTLSFSFRLFGNIFAGGVLLIVISSLLPVLLPSVFYMLEIFVGTIQALVFGILTLVFMNMATHAHGDDHEHEEEAAEAYA
jgi:F-type H+-transporting ATPase subunit a